MICTVDSPKGYCWTKWPTRPVLTLYWYDGELARRSRAASFDLTDNWASSTGYVTQFRFGISSHSSSRSRWTERELLRQEENIRYDLSEDGFDVDIRRLKGRGLAMSDEALWELYIDTI